MSRYFWFGAVGWSIFMALFGAGIAFFLTHPLFSASVLGPDSELRSSGHLTNPLLECEFGADIISSRKQDFTPELTAFINILKNRPGVDDVAVYYRDLNNGPTSNVNADETFVPASLLKVPMMMSYFSRAETDPALLEKKILFAKASDKVTTQQVPSEETIEVGKTYTIHDLIQYMVKYSDNQAMALLFDDMPVKEQLDLYSLLGVDPDVLSSPSAELTVRQYSIFFRILFNASFLSRAHSEEALTLLSQSTFNDGIRAGVPKDVIVAHKFGERKFDNGPQQLHDCGIVYYPKHPYLLCVMTRGQNTNTLLKALSETSKFVYEKIDAQYGKN